MPTRDTIDTGPWPDSQSDGSLSVEDLAAIYVLDQVRQFGPVKFRELLQHRIRPRDVLDAPELLPVVGKRGDSLRDTIRAIPQSVVDDCQQRALRQTKKAHELGATIISYAHPAYPSVVLHSNYPLPILYVRGSLTTLSHPRAVACVGSRQTRPPYSSLHGQFCSSAIQQGFSIVSGFALGADSIGHQRARSDGGQTVCVMPGGLDRPFPPENRTLWTDLLGYDGAVFVSEYAFGMSASALSLRKRNKLIVSFALGVLISQSAVTGGAMNALRFSSEQRKPAATFASDGRPDTSGNQAIASSSKNTTVFPTDADPAAFRQWLSTLSSSI